MEEKVLIKLVKKVTTLEKKITELEKKITAQGKKVEALESADAARLKKEQIIAYVMEEGDMKRLDSILKRILKMPRDRETGSPISDT
jgi:uncharacterized coiled-coil protein SlyX